MNAPSMLLTVISTSSSAPSALDTPNAVHSVHTYDFDSCAQLLRHTWVCAQRLLRKLHLISFAMFFSSCSWAVQSSETVKEQEATG